MPRSLFTRRARRAAAIVVTSLTLAAGCSAEPAAPDAPPTAPGLPSHHVYGVAVNPGDDLIYLASHDGLFRYDSAGPQRVGPVIDLMGFTVAGPDHFYASGHPGPGTDLPNPVGLVESTDAGQTWTTLSRQGESDFHALTASRDGQVLGYDGDLAASTDGATWTTLSIPAPPYALAAGTDGAVTLATSSVGLLRSTDAGRSWTITPDAPLIVLADWVDGRTVTGITADGTVTVSTDTGLTWQRRGTAGPPQAITAHSGPDGRLAVAVVTDEELLLSRDGGDTFQPFPAPANR
jgi:hypothetical protein